MSICFITQCRVFLSIMKIKNANFILSNLGGAFSDAAILLPLLILLAQNIGFSSVALLLSAGVIYIITGLYFRIPMPVQPLKSLVITAIAIPASFLEVRVATFLLGSICLLCCWLRGPAYLAYIPKRFIHGIQVALGIILMLKGVGLVSGFSLWLLPLVLILLCFLSSQLVIGWLALSGVVLAFTGVTTPTSSIEPAQPAQDLLRLQTILLLVVPQIFLTLTNSVVATHVVAQHYFKNRAFKVTQSRLLASIGFGNVVAGLIAGLPFCHGSGGLTAHVRGGASHYISNLIIGGTLLAFGLCAWMSSSVWLHYPPLINALLLVAIGWFHVLLAKPSWVNPEHRLYLSVVVAVAAITQSLLWALVVGVILELTEKTWRFYRVTK